MCPGHSTVCHVLSPPFFSDLLGKNLDRPEGHTVQHGSNKGSGLLQVLFPLPGHIFQTKPLSIYLPIYLSYIYIYVCVCVCVCMGFGSYLEIPGSRKQLSRSLQTSMHFLHYGSCALNWNVLFGDLF